VDCQLSVLPFEGLRQRTIPRRRCRRLGASQEVRCSKSVVNARPVEYWVFHPRHFLHRFRWELRFLPSAVPRLTYANRVHPLVSLPPLQSPFFLCPPSSYEKSAFHGVAYPLRDINRPQVYAGLPRAQHLSVLGVSHALDGLLCSRPCGFISPHSHVQGSPFRGLFLSHSRSASSTSRALSSLTSKRCQQLPTSATFQGPALRALFHARIRSLNDGV